MLNVIAFLCHPDRDETSPPAMNFPRHRLSLDNVQGCALLQLSKLNGKRQMQNNSAYELNVKSFHFIASFRFRKHHRFSCVRGEIRNLHKMKLSEKKVSHNVIAVKDL